ncbi:MAG TPA: sugar MFS transporter [Rhodanobacteraceae bacterium]|nr:sugar MFS transporter [Rhodanobacteraceae bacterium]
MTVMATVFFMWGFITVLNDVLIPHLKSLFALDYFQVMLVQFVFFGAYFLMSLPSGAVVTRYGYRASIVIGLIVTGIGALLFLPAARVQSYDVFLLAFFVLASGITLLQVAANPYVASLGRPERASSRLNLVQALNSAGTMIAPAFGGMLILGTAVLGAAELGKLAPAAQAAYRVQQAHAVEGPYIGIAVVLILLAALVWAVHLPAQGSTAHADDAQHRYADALKLPRVWLGMLAIFVYVGAEVSLGSFMINYLAMPEIGNLPEARAALFVSLYWGGAMVGRFIGSWLLTRIETRRLLVFNATIAALLVITTMLAHGPVAVATVVAVGLFNSVMFPSIFALGIEGMGALTGKVSSLLVMAIVGGAIIPLAQGALADSIGLHHAFLLPLACYLYILYYGARGSRTA